jgi:hypothetical protein
MLVSVIMGGVQVRSFVEIIWNSHLRVVSQLCTYVLI